MSIGFLYAMELIFRVEGGLVFNTKDPGGITNHGISLKHHPEIGEEGIRNLTKEQAQEIYKKEYWDVIRADELPIDVAICMFDCAINQGPAVAVGLLEESLGLIRDGKIDDDLIKRAHALDKDYLVDTYLYFRTLRYFKSENFSIFGKGWIRRLFATCRHSSRTNLHVNYNVF